MSWYPAELTRCTRCGKRFSTPIELFQHQGNGGATGRGCLVQRTADGYVHVKIGTHGSEGVKTRNVVEEGRVIRVQRLDGSRVWAKVIHINESAVFLELCDAPLHSPHSELHRAYLEGKRAAKKGLLENPYPMPQQQRGTRNFGPHASWRRGWLAGKRF